MYRILKILCAVLLLLCLCGYAYWERQQASSLSLPAVLNAKAVGTPIRLEREYKLGLSAPEAKFTQAITLAEGLKDTLDKALEDKTAWRISSELENFYYCTFSPKDFLFRDIYFDTKDDLNQKHAISFRLRHRWKSYKDYRDYESRQFDRRFFPIRCEIQVKTDRRELGDGYSNVNETRFEFRDASLPFSDINPAPPAPWDFEEYLHYAVTGRFMNYIISPAKEYAGFLLSKEPDLKRIWLKPKLVVLTRRFRIHLNVNTPWGSGPNPDNAFIVSMDFSEILGPEYMDYLLQAKYRTQKLRPPSRGNLREMEIEFERNVSTVLDKEIEDLEKSNNSEDMLRLERVREAFLADQLHLEKVVKGYFSENGIELVPVNRSKYNSACDVLSDYNSE
jgi:hypothetical protein